MKLPYLCLIVASAAMLTACGTRSSASVSGEKPMGRAVVKKTADNIVLTEQDITNRTYESLGDIEVTVSKWTIFDDDPTRAKVDQALKEKAADMGADAVVLVRYGTVGVSLTSWGSLDGHGRAVVFK